MRRRNLMLMANNFGSPAAEPVIPTAILGTLAVPGAGGTNLNKTTTWVQMESLPIPSELTEVSVNATATGTLKIKVLQPIKGGSFNVIKNETVTISASGVSEFSVEAGTLTGITIPANALVAYHTPSSGGAQLTRDDTPATYWPGNLSGSGDLSGNAVALNGAAYANQLSVQHTRTFDRDDVPGAYIVDENFAGTALPAMAVNNAVTAWSFAVAGKTTSAGVGLANFLDWYHTSNADRMTWAVEFLFTGASDRFAIYRKPILGETGTDNGTIVEVDLAGNNLIIYEPWSGGTNFTLPSIEVTHAISGITLATATRYRVELIRSAKTITAKITDVVGLVSDEVSVSNASADACGHAHGRPGFANLAGSADVRAAQLYAAVTNPAVLIGGTSISGDTTSVLPTQLYSQLTLDRLSGSGWYSSDGGTKAVNIMRRLRHEMRYTTALHVIVEAGANDAGNNTDRDAYPGVMQDCYDTIINGGRIPVIMMPMPQSDATINARLDVMRAAILAKGWRVVRSDIALSVGGDGSTYDSGKMHDSVHPNATGHIALDARIVQDWPEIFA